MATDNIAKQQIWERGVFKYAWAQCDSTRKIDVKINENQQSSTVEIMWQLNGVAKIQNSDNMYYRTDK